MYLDMDDYGTHVPVGGFWDAESPVKSFVFSRPAPCGSRNVPILQVILIHAFSGGQISAVALDVVRHV